MKVYFLDTSALVKSYVSEAGSGSVEQLMEKTRTEPRSMRVFVSRLAYPEAISAVTRRHVERTLSDIEAELTRRRIGEEFLGRERIIEILEPRPETVNHAALLVAKHRLRGFDAVHLATAISLRQTLLSDFEFFFLSADERLTRAAAQEQLPTVPLLN